MVGCLKRTKSVQPKGFEEDVQNSPDRGERKRKQKLQAENSTPTDGDSPKEPVEPDSKETNQSLDNNQDVPSSISKEKKASEQV